MLKFISYCFYVFDYMDLMRYCVVIFKIKIYINIRVLILLKFIGEMFKVFLFGVFSKYVESVGKF